MKNRQWMSLLIAAGLLVFTGAAFAAEGGPPPGGEPGQNGNGPGGRPGMHGQGPQDGGRRQEVKEKLLRRAETMIVWQVADELDLSIEKEEEFLGVMREHFRERNDLAAEEREIQQEIARHVKEDGGGAEKEELEKKLDTLRSLREQKRESEDKLHERLGDILTVEQQAKFVHALPEATRQVMDRIRQQRERMEERMKDHNGPMTPGDQPGGPGGGKPFPQDDKTKMKQKMKGKKGGPNPGG